MSLLSRLRVAHPRVSASSAPVGGDRGVRQPLRAAATSGEPPHSPKSGRSSNGLKEFLSQLEGIDRGHLLDLGSVSQSTVSFFIERGFKVSTEDFFSSWSAFLRAEEELLRSLPPGAEPIDFSAAGRAERFLSSNLCHAPESFDAILIWDILDYLDRDAMSRVVARLSTLLRNQGAILGMFHTRLPVHFRRYRVLDAHHLVLVPAPPLLQPRHVYQNREIQELFEGFRSSKTFVGRDQLREGVFVK